MNASLLMLIGRLHRNSLDLLEASNSELIDQTDAIFDNRFFILDEIKKNIEKYPEDLAEIREAISEQVEIENNIVKNFTTRQEKISEKLLNLNKSAKAHLLYKDY